MRWTLLLEVVIVFGTLTCAVNAQTCYIQSVSYQSVPYTVVGYHSQTYYQSCGFLGWGTCTRYKIVSTTAYQSMSEAIYASMAVCCSGYVGTHPDCIPVCDSPSCVNGVCQSPNNCQCNSGWSGEGCDSPVCTNTCVNGACTAPDSCTCDSGFTGSTCTQDVNECETGSHNCYSSSNCINNDGSFTCNCPAGFTLDPNGYSCTDINECDNSNGGCDHNCTNSDGSYTCSCIAGFFLDEGDKQSCLDHDECSSPANNCEQLCLNHDGYFTCACELGCQLQQDDFSCSDVDECVEGTSGCTQQCTNSDCKNGRYSCSCNSGYTLQPDNHTCTDNNECDTNNGGCDQTCTNSAGSYECSCFAGYELANDSFTCIALPCPDLIEPDNGGLICTGQLVTNESCAVECSPGYQVSGTATIDCLPSGTWSSDIASCPPKLCKELLAEDNALVISPCYREFQSICTQVCVNGYYLINGTSFDQMCALQGNDEVKWTDPETCQEILPCSPNPCQHGGVCSISYTGSPLCDCSSTYTGVYCQTLVIQLPPLPFLRLDISSSFTIYASPDIVLSIQIMTSSSIDVSPSNFLQIAPGENNVTFGLIPHSEGIFPISYNFQSVDGVAMSETAVISVGSDSSNDYFTSHGLPSGILGKGCCMLDSSSVASLCPSGQLSLISTCSWTSSDDSSFYTTSGITFISSAGLELPLSIAGMDGTVQDGLNFTLTNNSCGSCNYSTFSTDCYRYQTTPSDIDDILSANALLHTFLAAVESILPQQASIKQGSANENNGYRSFDYQAAITSISMESVAAGCETLKLPDGTYYILKTTTPLSISLATAMFDYAPKEPVCFAVNICNGFLSSVIMSVTKDLSDLLSSAGYLMDFYTAGFDVAVESIELSAQGHDSLNGIEFWNGSGRYEPSVPSYNLRMQLFVSGDVGSVISSNLTFSGAVSTSLSEGTILSQFSGDFRLSLNVISLNSSISFQSKDENGIFTSALSINSGDGMFQHGWGQRNLKISSAPLPSVSGLFALSIDIPGTDVYSCLFDAYTHLDDSLEVEWVSFTSSCVVVRINKLDFINMDHVFTISKKSSGKAMITISSTPKEFPLSLGKFIEFQDYSDIKERMVFSYSEEGNPLGSLFLARVSVLDSSVLTNLTINGDQLTFQENITIFDHYKFEISGLVLASESWDDQVLHLAGTAHNNEDNFLQDLNQYIYSVIGSRVLQTNKRITEAMENVERAGSNLELVSTELSQATNEFETKSAEYMLALASAEYLNALSQSNATVYQNALNAFNVTENFTAQIESVCNVQDCEQLCIPETTIDVCYKQVSLAVPDTCSQNEAITTLSIQSTPYLSYGCIYKEECVDQSGITWVISPYTLGYSNTSVPISHPLSWMDKHCFQNCIVSSKTEYSYQHTSSETQQTVNYICSGLVHNSLTPYICVSSSACICYASERSCSNANNECLTLRNQTWIEGLEVSQQEEKELNDLYLSFLTSMKEAITAQLAADSLMANLNLSEQFLKSVELSYNESVLAYNVSVESYQQVLLDLQDDLLLVQWLANYSTPDNLIQVTNISFSVSITSDTLSKFPILVTYLMPYSGLIQQTSIFVDFSAPIELVKDLVGSDITQHALESVATSQFRRRKSVTKRQSEESTTNTMERFEINCNYLQELLAYYAQVNTTLLDKHNETLEAQTSISGAISQLELVVSATSPQNLSALDAEIEYYNTLLSVYNQLLGIASVGEVESWRSRMDAYHNSTGSLVGFPCFSFSDCQKITVNVLLDILEDTPLNIVGTLQLDLSGVDSGLSILTIGDDLLFADAISIITSTFEFIESINDTGYWCALPPNITMHPEAQVSVELGESLNLHCGVQSTLPVLYTWIKDNITLSFATASTLRISEFEESDAGSYVCKVSNAVASRQSTASVVSFHQQPIITQHPSDIATYIGNENGAQFSCEATAYPVLQWLWFHQPLGSTIWVEVGNSTSILVIDTVYHEQEGLYRCIADNTLDLEQSSEPASLVLLPFTVTRPKYSVKFTVTSSDPSATTTVVSDVVSSLLLTHISLNNSKIESVSVASNNNGFTVSFSLLGINVTTPSTIYNSLESISTDFTASLTDLDLARASVQSQLTDTNSSLAGALSNSSIELVSISLVISHREYLCPEGQGLHENYILCVSCAPGHYWNGYMTKSRSIEVGSLVEEIIPQCSPCPQNYYQSAIGSSHCQQCPQYHSTLTAGAKSADQCQALCSPNSYSVNGFPPCQSCELGYYQPLYGSSFCFICQLDSNSEQCPSELPTTSSSVAVSPSISSIPNKSFEITAIIIGASLGVIACCLCLLLIICVLFIYKMRKKKMVTLSKSSHQYDYVDVNRGHINDGDTFKKKPLDSNDDLWNNPMYDNPEDALEKEVYTNVSNPMYEDTTGPEFAAKLFEKSSGYLASVDSHHMHDTNGPYLKAVNSKASHQINEETSTYITTENPLYAET